MPAPQASDWQVGDGGGGERMHTLARPKNCTNYKKASECHRTGNQEQGRVMLKQYLGWQWGDLPGGSVAKLHAPNAGGLGLIPGKGTISHMLQLKKTPHATRKIENPMCCKTQCS